MITRRDWFLGIAFLLATFSTLINPVSYGALVFLFCLMTFLVSFRARFGNCFNWQVKGGIVLLSLLVFCLIVPQVETNTTVLTSPLDHLRLWEKSSSDVNFA